MINNNNIFHIHLFVLFYFIGLTLITKISLIKREKEREKTINNTFLKNPTITTISISKNKKKSIVSYN